MRQGWHDYWMEKAALTATRATCPRAQVGCVLVRDNVLVIEGYNGALPHESHCSDEGVGCDMVDGHCVRARHAERNALDFAARFGRATAGAIAYVTHYPCLGCYGSLVQAGVKTIVYLHKYGNDPRVQDLSQRHALVASLDHARNVEAYLRKHPPHDMPKRGSPWT